MTRPRLLDLYCGAGGCSKGYFEAGFDVVGVDVDPQPNYPYEFVQADALKYVSWLIEAEYAHVDDAVTAYNCAGGHLLSDFAAIHASPPCQAYSAAKRIGNARPGHKDLVGVTRDVLIQAGRPWIIENVPGSPLDTHVELCGTQFGLPLRRHRFFESSEFLFSHPNPCRHRDGDLTVFGHVVQICGSRGTAYKDAKGRTHYRPLRVGIEEGRDAMGIDWMNRGELSQAIPPVFTEYLGRQLLSRIRAIDVAGICEAALKALLAGKDRFGDGGDSPTGEGTGS